MSPPLELSGTAPRELLEHSWSTLGALWEHSGVLLSDNLLPKCSGVLWSILDLKITTDEMFHRLVIKMSYIRQEGYD